MIASAGTAPILRRARWILPEAVDAAVVERLSAELHLPPVMCRLLAGRGFREPDSAKVYLRPRLNQLHGPMLVSGMDQAIARLARAIRGQETILVHGDYDVDGMCSTTIMVQTIRALGGKAVPFIPLRLRDGYDLSRAGVNAVRDCGATVVLTCDCGTSAHGPIAELQGTGIDVIVADHHLPSAALPAALTVLNPRRPGCTSPDKDLAAAGVAFKLALAITRELGGNENVVIKMLDLVALATVADVAPLRGENRVMVRYGLRLLNASERPGIQALLKACGMSGRRLTAGRIAFILAPRLNAAGRLAHAMRGVELLMSTSEHEANAIARELEELNAQRQDIDRATLDQARDLVQQLPLADTYGIVLANAGWHPGVIGIVASRLVEEFGRPAILIALDGEEGKGSGRSISAFDLHAGLVQCRDLLLRFGGHRAAAGVTIASARVEEFRDRFNQVAASQLTDDDLQPEIRTDLEIELTEATDELERLLHHMEPCGIANPSPVFVSRSVTLAQPPRIVGKDGLRLVLRQGARDLPALGWTMAARAEGLAQGQRIDVAYRLERDEYNGESRLQAKLVDFRA